MRLLTLSALLLLSSTQAFGQVLVFRGPPPNTTHTLDFNDPALTPGAIAGTNPVFSAAGVADIAVVGSWATQTTTLSALSFAAGNCLTVNGGVLSIAGPTDKVERPMGGAGYDITLTTPVEEFGFSQAQNLLRSYFRVELFSGTTFVGAKSGTFSPQDINPSGAAHVRADVPFDRIRFTYNYFTGTAALNRIYLGTGTPAEPPLPEHCVETTFTGHLGGTAFNTFFFDVDATLPIEIQSLRAQTYAAPGAPASLELYTVPGSYIPHVGDISAWTLASVDDGSAVTAGIFAPTQFPLTNPVILPTGTTGIALVIRGTGHIYSYSDGFNRTQESANGAFTISMGTSAFGVFSGSAFNPRVWSGRLCAPDADTGANYCSPAVPNSTGLPSSLYGLGGASIAENKLKLIAENVPSGAFGFFLASRLQDLVPQPGGSAGNLCLGGDIGRYVAPGQVQAANENGILSLGLDLAAIPQPQGAVAGIAGEAWYFQAWHRDAVGGIAGSNFTNGLEVILEN